MAARKFDTAPTRAVNTPDTSSPIFARIGAIPSKAGRIAATTAPKL